MKNSNNKNAQSTSHSAQTTSQMSDMLNRTGLNDLPQKIQQFGSSTMERVGNLSTTQKVVGGTLLALGAGWVTMNSVKGKNLLVCER